MVQYLLGEIIRPDLLSGNAPDFIYLPTSNKSGVTNALIKDKLLAALSDVFADPEIKEKILPGFIDNIATNPYGDGKVYLAPLYYSTTGLFYNKTIFEQNGWDVPVTWDDFYALGDKAKEKGRALITYQGLAPGYMEAMLMPAASDQVDLAKEFLKFQYSDEAVALNAENAKGIPPVKGAAEQLKDKVSPATYETYKLFDQGYVPSIVRFATDWGLCLRALLLSWFQL